MDLEPEVSIQPGSDPFDEGLLSPRQAAVVVAHPDDEALWAGGLILSRPHYRWFIVALTRKSDLDRAPRFYSALEYLNAEGRLGDLDDGPDQTPLPEAVVQEAILDLLEPHEFAFVLTHGPHGEYTRHRRHEEISAAVRRLWISGLISAQKLWMFAYEDGEGRYLPRETSGAHYRRRLSEEVWRKKYQLITEIYGFSPYSWEARVTPQVEAFWCFDNSSHENIATL